MSGQFFKNIFFPLVVTLLILIVLEIFSTTLFPLLGMEKYRVPFNILIILFMGFKINTPWLAILIMIVQYFHSYFSIEGWEMGTIAGVVICIVISYLKDLLHFSNSIITIFVTQMFQMLWFVIVSGLAYMKIGEWSYILEKFWRFIPESIIISLLAPVVFAILDRIWVVGEDGMLGDNG